MNDLTPTLLAEKIKQLLSGGVELEQIQAMALKQGVDPILFSEALDIIQGKVTESMEAEVDKAVEAPLNLKKWIIIGGATLGLIVLIFLVYVFWSKNTVPEKLAEPVIVTETTLEKSVDPDPAVLEALDFIEDFETDSNILDDDFYETLTDDFNLSNVTVIEDSSSRGSQLFSEEESTDDFSEEEEGEVLVSEIEVGRYEITGLPRTVKPGEEYEFEVAVYDTDDKIIDDYNQTIEFRSTARSIIITPFYTFEATDKGKAKQIVIFNTLGKHTLAVNAKGDSSKRAQVTVRIRE